MLKHYDFVFLILLSFSNWYLYEASKWPSGHSYTAESLHTCKSWIYLRASSCLWNKNMGGNLYFLKVPVFIFLTVFLQLALLTVFLLFFGLPAVQRFRAGEVMVMYSKEATRGIEAPSITAELQKGKTAIYITATNWVSFRENRVF